jgi:hypothetical protein
MAIYNEEAPPSSSLLLSVAVKHLFKPGVPLRREGCYTGSGVTQGGVLDAETLWRGVSALPCHTLDNMFEVTVLI